MTSSRGDVDYLRDIVESTQGISQFIAGLDAASFARDDQTVFAVVRAMGIIGEAAKSVSEQTRRRYPDVPWADMARTRDKPIHAYFGVNTEVVWKTAQDDVPSLRALVGHVLESERQAGTA